LGWVCDDQVRLDWFTNIVSQLPAAYFLEDKTWSYLREVWICAVGLRPSIPPARVLALAVLVGVLVGVGVLVEQRHRGGGGWGAGGRGRNGGDHRCLLAVHVFPGEGHRVAIVSRSATIHLSPPTAHPETTSQYRYSKEVYFIMRGNFVSTAKDCLQAIKIAIISQKCFVIEDCRTGLLNLNNQTKYKST